MKKFLIILSSLLLTGIYLSFAINLDLSSGDELISSDWDKISNITNKINLSGNDLNVSGKLVSSGKICVGNTCLGICESGKVWDNSSLSCVIPATTKETAGSSCYSIKESNSGAVDGVYWIDPNGGDTSDAFQVYCDMTEDGGGWTLVGVNGDGSIQLKGSGAYNVPVLNTTSAVDWKFSDSVINNIKGGTESNINGFRMTYNKKSNLGDFYPKRYFWSRACNFNASQLAETGGSECLDWSVDVNLVGTYSGDTGLLVRYGIQRRKSNWKNLGWYRSQGYTRFNCYEGSSYDGANQTGYCEGDSYVTNVAHYMWVR